MTAAAFVEDVLARLDEQDAPHHIAEYLERLLHDDPDGLRGALGDGTGSEVLHRSERLTVVKVVMLPRYRFFPHEHRTWAVVSTVRGREENVFFERDDGQLEATGNRVFGDGDVGVLPHDVVHAVANLLDAETIGLHVYGGDLLAAGASEWDPDTHEERPYLFEAEAARKAAWAETLARSP